MNYICFDCGGTKTLAAIYDENKKKLGEELVDSCHYSRVGFEGIYNIFSSLVKNIISKYKLQKGNTIISIGLAGYGNAKDISKKIKYEIDRAFVGFKKIYLMNDAQTAIYGALGGNEGILLICGTGSIAMSYKNNKIKRCGGWGYKIGDEGSAYYIGKLAISVFSKTADGRIKNNKLYEELKRYFDIINDYDIISKFETLSRKDIASLAKIVYIGAKYGDEVSLQIFDNAAKELALCVNVLAKDFNNVVLSYCGSVFKSNEILLNPLKKYLNEKVSIQKPIFSPEEGAFLIAKNDIHFDN